MAATGGGGTSSGGIASTNYARWKGRQPRGSAFAQKYLMGVTRGRQNATGRNKEFWKSSLKRQGLDITTFGKKGIRMFRKAASPSSGQKHHIKLVKYLKDKNPGFRKQLKQSQKYNMAGLMGGK